MSKPTLEELKNIIDNAQDAVTTAQKNIEHAQEQIKAMKEAEKPVWSDKDIGVKTVVVGSGGILYHIICFLPNKKIYNTYSLISENSYVDNTERNASEMVKYLNKNQYTKA